jgi:branched-chain amino acid aminotransferase
MKPKLLAELKSTNYMLNVLTGMQSREKGGLNGIQVFPDGRIAEGPVNSIGFILPGAVFVTPAFDSILTGTGMERAMIIAARLKEEGVLTDLQQRDITQTEAMTAVEIFTTYGDKVTGISHLNDQIIGNGEIGEVTKLLQQAYYAELLSEDLTTPIPYHNYES